MARMLVLLFGIILVTYGECQKTQIRYIGNIPILVAGTPVPTQATPITPSVTEATTPTLEDTPGENVTEINDEEAEEANLTPTTPTVSKVSPTPTTPGLMRGLKPKYIKCDNDTDCKQHKFERCRKFRVGHPGKCTCIAGHTWAKDGNSCIPVKYYSVTVTTMNEYVPEYNDRSTVEYRYMEYQAREGFYEAIKASKLGSILVGAKSSCGFQNSTSGHVMLNFKMRLSRSYAPEQTEVQEDIIEGIRSVLLEKDDDVFTLSNTIVLIDNNTVSDSQVIAPDPCSSGYMNYCDENAECMASTRSFSCHCKDGYTDVSFNKRETPGERCELQCGCSKNGQCVHTEDKGVHCQCYGWYLGDKCTVDGELLLMVLSAIIGALLLIGICCCCCCMYRMRKSLPDSDDSTSMTTLEKHQTDSTAKSPHSWVNTWRYYNFTPSYPMNNPYSSWVRPHSGQRRNSKHSRVEPYPGTIMMYPSELSIPRPQVAPVGYNPSFYY